MSCPHTGVVPRIPLHMYLYHKRSEAHFHIMMIVFPCTDIIKISLILQHLNPVMGISIRHIYIEMHLNGQWHSFLGTPQRWIWGMDKWFHPTFHNGCDYLSMLVLKLINVGKKEFCTQNALACTLQPKTKQSSTLMLGLKYSGRNTSIVRLLIPCATRTMYW